MKKETKKVVKYQYRGIKETGELILVYVNYNANDSTKKWYECYDIYGAQHFETTKEYLLTKTIKENPSYYIQLTHILRVHNRIEKDAEIVNRLPSLK